MRSGYRFSPTTICPCSIVNLKRNTRLAIRPRGLGSIILYSRYCVSGKTAGIGERGPRTRTTCSRVISSKLSLFSRHGSNGTYPTKSLSPGPYSKTGPIGLSSRQICSPRARQRILEKTSAGRFGVGRRCWLGSRSFTWWNNVMTVRRSITPKAPTPATVTASFLRFSRYERAR